MNTTSPALAEIFNYFGSLHFRNIMAVLALLMLPWVELRAQSIPLYHLTFAGAQLTNSGALGGDVLSSSPDATAIVGVAEDETLGSGGYAAEFPLSAGGRQGPVLTLPLSTKHLDLGGEKDALTISAWVKWNGPAQPSDPRQVIASNMPTTMKEGWAFALDGKGLLTFQYRTASGGGSNRTSLTGIPQGAWTHVAVTWQNDLSNALAFYINGVSVGVNQPHTGTGPLKASGNPIVLGGGGFSSPLNGSLADVRLYASALDESEIKQCFQTKATGTRYVFAHYMVCLPTAGPSSTVQDFKNEILQAQARGIDGFALNCGEWTRKNTTYKQRVSLIYQAAKNLGTRFKLFISADMTTGLTNDEIADMVETFRDHPNQMRHQGRPVLSSFGGNQPWTDFITSTFGPSPCPHPAVFSVPFYYAHGVKGNPVELPTLAQSQEIYAQNPKLDGFFYFGAAGAPAALASCIRETASVWRGANKLFMAPVTPYYRGFGGNYRVFEYEGYEGLIKQWQAAIESADWVEMVTWNDWGESSYFAPFGAPNTTLGTWSNLAYKSSLCHTGYLDLSSYYIRWFKLGYPPAIQKDTLYYAYRLHQASTQGLTYSGTNQTLGTPNGASNLKDNIYVTVLSKDRAQLAVCIGEKQYQFRLLPGVNNVSVPMEAGQPRFILTRNGQTVVDQWGEQSIADSNNWANFQYFSSSSDAGSFMAPPELKASNQ